MSVLLDVRFHDPNGHDLGEPFLSPAVPPVGTAVFLPKRPSVELEPGVIDVRFAPDGFDEWRVDRQTWHRTPHLDRPVIVRVYLVPVAAGK